MFGATTVAWPVARFAADAAHFIGHKQQAECFRTGASARWPALLAAMGTPVVAADVARCGRALGRRLWACHACLLPWPQLRLRLSLIALMVGFEVWQRRLWARACLWAFYGWIGVLYLLWGASAIAGVRDDACVEMVQAYEDAPVELMWPRSTASVTDLDQMAALGAAVFSLALIALR